MTEAAWVYLLRCRDGSLYTGWTIDLDRRLARHQAGSASRYTASRRPVEIAVAFPMGSRTEARREEARIKRLDRAAKLALIAGSAPDQSSRGAGAKTIRLSSVRALPPSRSAV
jgi:putative endonuclease